jgi:hypothetical protein
MAWYLVIQTPELGLDSALARNYKGLNGLAWPLDEPEGLVQEMEDAIYSNEESLCSIPSLALEYFDLARTRLPSVRLLRCTAPDDASQEERFSFIGYDFGDRRGGYSILYDEIARARYDEFRPWQIRLNAFGLLPELSGVAEYLSFRAALPIFSRLEDINGYAAVRLSLFGGI